MNTIHVLGRLGRDPELRHTNNDKAVCNFTLASDDGFGDYKQTTWFRVQCWGKTAEACDKYLSKGRQCYVVGRMQEREWEDKQGEKRRTWELVAQSVQFVGDRAREDGDKRDGSFERGADKAKGEGKGGAPLPPVDPDSDIPFAKSWA